MSRQNATPKSLLAALELDFPDETLVLGGAKGDGTRRGQSVDRTRLRRNLKEIDARLRRRSTIIVVVVLSWLAALMLAALLSSTPYANLVALGGMSGGTIWCVSILRRIYRELAATEIMLVALAQTGAPVAEIVSICRALLTGALDNLAEPSPVGDQEPAAQA